MILLNHTKVTCLLIILILVTSVSNIQAQSETKITAPLAYSNPIINLTVDGKLYDWPSDTKKYSIDKALWNVENDGENDFSTHFMYGYNTS